MSKVREDWDYQAKRLPDAFYIKQLKTMHLRMMHGVLQQMNRCYRYQLHEDMNVYNPLSTPYICEEWEDWFDVENIVS